MEELILVVCKSSDEAELGPTVVVSMPIVVIVLYVFEYDLVVVAAN